ncbi:MAG: hypothetical protein R3C13_02635 [Hyphomonas sp.]|uniref:hypothetical protein n=1 Tax=Hyphomonas sp. TaxID=87 RepID=UPI0035281C23
MMRAAGLLAGLLLAACAGTPPAVVPKDPVAACHALFDGDAEMAAELARAGADGDDLCTCFAREYAGLDAAGQADMLALTETLVKVRDANGFTTAEEAVELMEEDRDGAAYGFEEKRFKATGEVIEEAILRARRDPAGCTAP